MYGMKGRGNWCKGHGCRGSRNDNEEGRLLTENGGVFTVSTGGPVCDGTWPAL